VRENHLIIFIDELNDAFEKIRDEDVRFRYVIDTAALKNGEV
jgi:uncharacterized zinc-type alcohol dehydrogenase-like protein